MRASCMSAVASASLISGLCFSLNSGRANMLPKPASASHVSAGRQLLNVIAQRENDIFSHIHEATRCCCVAGSLSTQLHRHAQGTCAGQYLTSQYKYTMCLHGFWATYYRLERVRKRLAWPWRDHDMRKSANCMDMQNTALDSHFIAVCKPLWL